VPLCQLKASILNYLHRKELLDIAEILHFEFVAEFLLDVRNLLDILVDKEGVESIARDGRTNNGQP